jgi:DNA-binding transcriptional regulator LsrR (DeoR family)
MADRGVQPKLFAVMSTNQPMGSKEIAEAADLELIVVQRALSRLKSDGAGRVKQLGIDQYIKNEDTEIKRTYTKRAGIVVKPGNTASKIRRLLTELGEAVSAIEENVMTPAQMKDYERLQGLEVVIKNYKGK